jgi:putative ABC transport system substrate-binding protein
MKKTTLLSIVVAVMHLAVGVIAQAQHPKKPRIGFLIAISAAGFSARTEAFRQGLRDLGYDEGKNIVIEYRYADGKVERLPELAAELVRLKVDVMVVGGTSATSAAKQATRTIPIVVGSAGDLVGAGLVASLARPGGNVTGSTGIAPDLSGKRLELLSEIVSKESRIALLFYPNPGSWDQVRSTETAAHGLGVKLQPGRGTKSQ